MVGWQGWGRPKMNTEFLWGNLLKNTTFKAEEIDKKKMDLKEIGCDDQRCMELV
jgi:hypothetical protein